MENQEEWRPVHLPQFADKYLISNKGKVRLLGGRKRAEREQEIYIMKQQTYQGYKYIQLSANGVVSLLRVHRLVAFAFLPKVDGKEVVNHIDFDKCNNDVSNLEWCTEKENFRHTMNMGRARFLRGGEMPNAKPILQYTKSGEFIKEWGSIADATRDLNIGIKPILSSLKGKKNICKYVFKFKFPERDGYKL